MRFASSALVLGLVAASGAQGATAAGDSKPAMPDKAATAGATAPKPAPAKAITGKVSGAGGKPVVGATVRAIPMPPRAEASMRGPARPDVPKPIVATTDASGAFRLDGAGAGPAAVRVEAAGFAPASAIDVPPGTVLDLRLKPGAVVVGRVLDLTTQKPVANATVTALEPDAARFGREAAHGAKSADDGTFRLTDCAPGIVVVEAVAPGKARVRLDRAVAKPLAPGEERDPDLNTLFLQPGGRIAGRVVGPDGKPLPDAIVTAAATDGSLFAMMRDARAGQRTGADGTFAFDGLPAGNRYTVRAAKDGLASREDGPVPVEAGTDRRDLELKLEAGAALAFRLLSSKDLPVKDVDVRLQPQGGSRRRGLGFGANNVERDRIEPQGDGKFLVRALDSGTFDLTLQPADFADVTRDAVKLKNGETTDLGTLRVKESKSIAGRVTDASGSPVEGAVIFGLSMEGDVRLSREAHSGADGRYRLSGLGEQPLRDLSVRAPGYSSATREGATPGDDAVDFTLERTGSVVGRVQLAGGAVPPAFRVSASPEAKEKQERPGMRIVVGARPDDEKVFSDPSGRFRIDGIEPGVVTVTATADGKAPGRKSGVDVGSDEVVDAGTLVLQDGRALRGRVVAAKDGAPVAGATVSVSQPQGFMAATGRDAAAGVAISTIDGRFEIAGLEPRAYAIDVSQPDFSPNSGRVEIGADADTDDFVIKLSRGGTITGLVRDAQKVPVPNAPVLLTKIPMGGGPQTASTGADGRYTFEKVPPGEYMVIRAPSGGGPLMLIAGMKQVMVQEGETTVHDLDESARINVTGRVLKASQPVANAMMFFSTGDGGGAPTDLRQTRTDADGRYRIGLDAPGAYDVVVNVKGGMMGGGRSATPVQVPDQPDPVVDVTLKSAGVSGRIASLDGKPISGAIVTVASTGSGEALGGHGTAGAQGQSDPDGSFLVDGLAPGTYKVSAAATGFRGAEAPPVTIANDDDVPSVEIRLEPGRSVRGRVVDANGNGIAGAMVVAAPAGTLAPGRGALPATSDVNGAFVVTAPADGPIDLTAVASGFPAARAASIAPEDGEEVVLHAPRPGRVNVTVVDGKGTAVAGARVTCRPVPEYLGAAYQAMLNGTLSPTDAEGATTAPALAPGSYELTVTSGSKRAAQAVTLAEGAAAALSVTLP